MLEQGYVKGTQTKGGNAYRTAEHVHAFVPFVLPFASLFRPTDWHEAPSTHKPDAASPVRIFHQSTPCICIIYSHVSHFFVLNFQRGIPSKRYRLLTLRSDPPFLEKDGEKVLETTTAAEFSRKPTLHHVSL